MPRKRVSQTSLEYWKKREDEARRIYLEQEKNYDEEISRIYNRMLKDVQLQINGFFGRYASSEGISVAEAKARADAMDVADFAEKAKKYVQTRDFSREANEALKLYNLTMKVNRLELLKANIGLEMCAGFDEMQKYFDTILVDRVQEECERQSGILGETIKSNAKMAKSLVGASFNNASFSDRIWMYQGMLRSELSSLLEQGIVQGKHANELARHLEKRFGVSKFSAQRLMRTEMARVQTEAQKQSFEQIGYKQYIFIAEHDSRTCEVCASLDGLVFDNAKMMPGTNASPMHPMCRCSTAAYMDRANFEKMVARSQVPAEEEPIRRRDPKKWRSPSQSTENKTTTADPITRRDPKGWRNRHANSNEDDYSKIGRMSNAELDQYVKNLKTEFISTKGVSNEIYRETVKVIKQYEDMIKDAPKIKVEFGGVVKGANAHYDDKNKTIHLKKTGKLEDFGAMKEETNLKYRIRWRRDKDYYATTSFNGVTWHELAHAIDFASGQKYSKMLMKGDLFEESVKVSVYAGERGTLGANARTEAWAENFSAYITNDKNKKRISEGVIKVIKGALK